MNMFKRNKEEDTKVSEGSEAFDTCPSIDLTDTQTENVKAPEVTKALERGKAKLVAVAGDISPPEIVMHLPLLAKEKDIPCVQVGGKEELGAASGITVSTTAVAIVEEGEAKKIIKDIADNL